MTICKNRYCFYYDEGCLGNCKTFHKEANGKQFKEGQSIHYVNIFGRCKAKEKFEKEVLSHAKKMEAYFKAGGL